MRVSRTIERGVMMLSVAVLVLQGSDSASAQYMPRTPNVPNGYQNQRFANQNFQNPNYQNPNYQNPNYQNPNYQNPNYQGARYQSPVHQNVANRNHQLQGQAQWQQRPMGPNPMGPNQQFMQQPSQAAQPQTAQPQAVLGPAQPHAQYTAMAYRVNENGNLSLASKANTGVGEVPSEAITAEPTTTAVPQAGGNPGVECTEPGYNGSAGGCADGSCNGGYGGGYGGGLGYNTFNNCGGGYGCGNGYGGYGCNDGNCGQGSVCRNGRWFGGVYGLAMERARSDWKPLAFSASAPAAGYYPTDNEVVFTTRAIDTGYQGGAEIRLGYRLGQHCGAGYGGYGAGCDGGCTGCDSYGGGSCGCGPQRAVEFVYWGLDEESAESRLWDAAAPTRIYGMMDFRGLEYNLGSGYRSVNEPYDYGPPTTDNTGGGARDDIMVQHFTARSTFSAQNLELNLLRLPVLCGGCNSGCASGCDSGGCDSGYGRVGPRFTLSPYAGIRYMRFDEDFMFRTDFAVQSAPVTYGFLSYNVETDNNLVGVQAGCNGVYHLGCRGRWALHGTTVLGIYGNHIRVRQYMNAPAGGVVRYANGTNENFSVDTTKDEFSMIGEFRLGASYQATCHCRLYSGWRVIGVSGVALAANQIPTSFITPSQLNYIGTNGSYILHGLQAGVEWNY